MKRDTNLFADESGGLPADVQQAVRDAAEKVLREIERGERSLPRVPSAERFLRMMRANVAQEVSPEYVPMMMEEMRFSERSVPWTNGKPAAALKFHVMIIGAGVSGICAAIKLDELGIPWTVLEKNPEVGGTWYENTYPDAGVDTLNHFYSYSFEPNFRWSGYFSKSAEVQYYVCDAAARRNVLQRVRFNTEVESLVWNEERREWEAVIRQPDGSVVTERANAVISAVGQLNRPKTPSLPGIDSFTGIAFHSAQCRHGRQARGGARHRRQRDAVPAHRGGEGRAPDGVPTLAAMGEGRCGLPRKVTPETMWLLEHVPYYFRWYRFGLLWRYGDGLLRSFGASRPGRIPSAQ